MKTDSRVDLLRSMLRIRRVEETLADLYPSQEMRTPTHFSIGQEAVAVGVCAALRRDDVVYSGHRCHAHYLAKGGDLGSMVAELYGRETGCARGRGGSVHLNDPEAGIIAASAILGQTMAVAVGTALAFSMDGRDQVDAAVVDALLAEHQLGRQRRMRGGYAEESRGHQARSYGPRGDNLPPHGRRCHQGDRARRRAGHAP